MLFQRKYTLLQLQNFLSFSAFNHWNSSKLSKIQDKRKNNSTLLGSNDVLTIVMINLRYTSLAALF